MNYKPLFIFLILLWPGLSMADPDPTFAGPEDFPDSGILVIPVAVSGEYPAALSDALHAALVPAAEAAGFDAKPGKTLSLYRVAGFDRVILVGTGDSPLNAVDIEDLGGTIAGALGRGNGSSASILLDVSGGTVADPGAHLALGLRLGGYRFDHYKSSDEDATDSERLPVQYTIYTEDPAANAAAWREKWAPLSVGVIFARDLITEPANVIYPESFVARTRAAFKGLDNVRIRVLDEKAMDKLGMGVLLGVGMGSERPPRLLIVEYSGGDKGEAPLAFVGKGVTFDSGGISLKRGAGMWKMKYDMSGAAAVTGAVLALAGRKAPVNAISVAALVENMPSRRAQRPGDVRRSLSGKTVEVINTDAEGRLILSDAVWYAQQEYSPALLVDMATLTGSVRTALGSAYAGLFTRQDAVAAALTAAGAASGEQVWRLPLHEDFRDAIKSDIADIKNTAEGGGGASVGAEVIGNFVKAEQPWAHLDIAGKAWATKAQPTVPKGAAGWGVRLLNQLVLDHYE